MTTRTSLKSLLDHSWPNHARCRNYPSLPWTGKQDEYDREKPPTPTEFDTMATICFNCPVQLKCAAYALTGGRNSRGVDGGFYAGVWIPWPTDYGHPGKRPDRSVDARRRLRELLKEATT